jgi:hypothetical protein
MTKPIDANSENDLYKAIRYFGVANGLSWQQSLKLNDDLKPALYALVRVALERNDDLWMMQLIVNKTSYEKARAYKEAIEAEKSNIETISTPNNKETS